MYIQKCNYCEARRLIFDRTPVCTACQSDDVIHKPLHLRGLVLDTAGIIELTLRKHDDTKSDSWTSLNLNDLLQRMTDEIHEFNNADSPAERYQEMADIIVIGAMTLNYLRRQLEEQGISVEGDLYGEIRLD